MPTQCSIMLGHSGRLLSVQWSSGSEGPGWDVNSLKHRQFQQDKEGDVAGAWLGHVQHI
jgi:hypothetical protein